MLLTTFGEFWLKTRKKTRKYVHTFPRNHGNKQPYIPLCRGASVFRTDRSKLHPPPPIFRRVPKFRKATFSFAITICPSACIKKKTRLPAKGLSRSLIRVFFENLSRKFEFIKICKNNGYFTRIPNYISDNISFSS